MLDNDETTNPGSIDNDPPAPPAKKASRARKATAAAGTPPTAPAVSADNSAGPAGEPAAPRKRTRKTAAPAPEPAAPQLSAPEPTEPTAPKKASRSRAKAAAPAVKAPADGASADTGANDPTGSAPARSRGSRVAKAGRKAAAPSGGEDAGSGDAEIDSAEGSAVPAMAAPAVLFQAPAIPDVAAPAKRAAKSTDVAEVADGKPAKAAKAAKGSKATKATKKIAAPALEAEAGAELIAEAEVADDVAAVVEELEADAIREAAIDEANGARRRRRRGRRGRGRQRDGVDGGDDTTEHASDDAEDGVEPADALDGAAGVDGPDGADGDGGPTTAARRRRRRRRADGAESGDAGDGGPDDPPNTVVHVRERRAEGRADSSDDGVRGVKGSTRLEAKRQRRRDGRDSGRRRPSILSEAEFLARRESVDRIMAVRQLGDRTQIAVLEDGVLVEHYVTRASATSYVGNVYLGRVQNVLPSMEAAFVDIGKGRNGVLYAGEVNWDAAGLEGKSRAIENALSPGDTVLVQVTKDPIGHKGARLTSQVSLPGRFLVYVPGGGMTGISRKLPDTERQRLKAILKKIVPEDAGVIIRTAAEGASEEELTHDVERLKAEWESISAKSESKKNAPALVHGEPDLATRVVRDVFNEDFKQLIVQGDEAWQTVSDYLADVAPDLAQRASRYTKDTDLFHDLRVDEGLAKALDRKVWLPSGGSLVIDRTEAMTVVDVNTGKFVGSGGNLEQTVTRNNLEAAEEIVRQLRLRDVGGIVVIDFIDMVLESNRDLVLRRLTECLGRDRTKHQVAEVTSLGLVQMTRKRVGEGLLEAFSEPCEVCHGRGVIIHANPVDQRRPDDAGSSVDDDRAPARKRGSRRGGAGAVSAAKAPAEEPVHIDTPEEIERRRAAAEAMAAIHRAASAEGDELSDALAQAASALEETDLVSAPLSSTDEPAHTSNGDAPVFEPEPAAPVRRRRRAASRPAGPPVATH